jgi:hypothetical protein
MHIAERRETAVQAIRAQVRDAARRLAHWRQKCTALLDGQEARARQRNQGRLPAIVDKRLTDERRHVERFVGDHQTWIQGLQSHSEPYIRLSAVLAGSDRLGSASDDVVRHRIVRVHSPDIFACVSSQNRSCSLSSWLERLRICQAATCRLT